jgi:DNA invertase Pin-like site-specific DNA recombinase
LADLEEVGVKFVSLRDGLDFTTAAGRFQVQVLAAVAEFEAGMIRDRVRAGLRKCKEKGIRLGKPPTIDRNEVLRLKQMGFNPTEIARELGVSRSGVRYILDNAAS